MIVERPATGCCRPFLIFTDAASSIFTHEASSIFTDEASSMITDEASSMNLLLDMYLTHSLSGKSRADGCRGQILDHGIARYEADKALRVNVAIPALSANPGSALIPGGNSYPSSAYGCCRGYPAPAGPADRRGRRPGSAPRGNVPDVP